MEPMTGPPPLAIPGLTIPLAIEAVGIVKSFPGVLANDHVDFDLRAKGAAMLLISEELEELLSLADRILVLYEGRVTASFDAPGAPDIDSIGLHMTGGDGSASATGTGHP